MLAAIRTWFGGRKAAAPVSDALPTECATLIAGLSFHHRDDDTETGAPRVICMLSDGGAGFRYGADTASAWLRKRFRLNDGQTERAMRMLRDRFAEWQRLQGAAVAGRGRPNYAKDWQ
ncbi:hypothetical protein [Burkholderia sp. MSMB175]|nr:hypothetical protein [Burkholderia sp. MSMB175]AOK29866.1 hypothetical protein AQ611_10960 [Burkholderia sp. Bp7605]